METNQFKEKSRLIKKINYQFQNPSLEKEDWLLINKKLSKLTEEIATIIIKKETSKG